MQGHSGRAQPPQPVRIRERLDEVHGGLRGFDLGFELDDARGAAKEQRA